jgi:hypothetical protein
MAALARWSGPPSSTRLASRPVFQSPKENEYRIAIAATRRLHRSQVAFRCIALTAQFLHPGTDRLEVISGTGLSHVSSSIRLGELW